MARKKKLTAVNLSGKRVEVQVIKPTVKRLDTNIRYKVCCLSSGNSTIYEGSAARDIYNGFKNTE